MFCDATPLSAMNVYVCFSYLHSKTCNALRLILMSNCSVSRSFSPFHRLLFVNPFQSFLNGL